MFGVILREQNIAKQLIIELYLTNNCTWLICVLTGVELIITFEHHNSP
jgi:hypothetical protein